jgi:hypothetical protein
MWLPHAVTTNIQVDFLSRTSFLSVRENKFRPPAGGLGWVLVGSQGRRSTERDVGVKCNHMGGGEKYKKRTTNSNLTRTKALAMYVPCAFKNINQVKNAISEIKSLPSLIFLHFSHVQKVFFAVACSFTRRHWTYCRPSFLIEGASNIPIQYMPYMYAYDYTYI